MSTADSTASATDPLAVDELLVETAKRLCAAHSARAHWDADEAAGWSPVLWRALSQSGFTRVGLPEANGGSGGTRAEAAAVVRAGAYAGSMVPLAESLLVAGPVLAAVGLEIPDGPIGVAPRVGELTAKRDGSKWQVHGSTTVAWGRVVDDIVALATGDEGLVVVVVPARSGQIVAAANLAGEPRDRLTFVGTPAVGEVAASAGLDELDWRRRGALARAVQIDGALERILEITIAHAKVRTQFGRPLNRFQAVGHMIALLAESVAMTGMAVDAGILGARAEDADVAKVIAGEAASSGATLAHQVFGAIGVTREGELQRLTRRLWSWRDEFGSELDWAVRSGRAVRDRGPDDLWLAITS